MTRSTTEELSILCDFTQSVNDKKIIVTEFVSTQESEVKDEQESSGVVLLGVYYSPSDNFLYVRLSLFDHLNVFYVNLQHISTSSDCLLALYLRSQGVLVLKDSWLDLVKQIFKAARNVSPSKITVLEDGFPTSTNNSVEYIFGDKVLYKDGTLVSANIIDRYLVYSNNLAAIHENKSVKYLRNGDSSDFFNFIFSTLPYSPILHLLIPLALSSRIVTMLNELGFILHLEGDTGIGKTKIFEFISMILGSQDTCLHSWRHTTNSLVKLCQTRNGNTLILNEIASFGSINDIKEMVHSIVDGKDKGRLNPDATQKQNDDFKVVVLSNGEEGDVDFVNTKDGVRARVLQLKVDQEDIFSCDKKRDKFFLDIASCRDYGHLMPAFSSFAIEYSDIVFENFRNNLSSIVLPKDSPSYMRKRRHVRAILMTTLQLMNIFLKNKDYNFSLNQELMLSYLDKTDNHIKGNEEDVLMSTITKVVDFVNQYRDCAQIIGYKRKINDLGKDIPLYFNSSGRYYKVGLKSKYLPLILECSPRSQDGRRILKLLADNSLLIVGKKKNGGVEYLSSNNGCRAYWFLIERSLIDAAVDTVDSVSNNNNDDF